MEYTENRYLLIARKLEQPGSLLVAPNATFYILRRHKKVKILFSHRL